MGADWHWFRERNGFVSFERDLIDPFASAGTIAASHLWPGHCAVCGRETRFLVKTGAMFADRPNLREGLRCKSCRLTARQRGLLTAMRQSIPPGTASHGHVFERLSRLFRTIRRSYPHATGSEYLSAGHRAGRHALWHPPGRPWRMAWLRHESITGMSYPDQSLDFLVHSDVLEHVADTRAALLECHRVLRDGGTMLFTVPFFSALDVSLLRGRLDGAGRLVELLPAEYHGDGMHRGAYTFHNFGWDLFDRLRAIFGEVEVGALHSPREGLVHADPQPGDMNMLPIVFRCRRRDTGSRIDAA